MALGPIEVIVIGFPGSEFNGDIMPELQRLVEEETITIVDGLLVTKSTDGEVDFAEFGEEGGNDRATQLEALLDQLEALISDEDVTEIAETLEPGSSAAILVFEHTWAKPFRDAVVASGGMLAANFRVPGLVIDELLSELAAADD